MTIQATNAAAAYSKSKMLNNPAANNNVANVFNQAMGTFNQVLQDTTAVYGGGMTVANEVAKGEKDRNKGRLSSFLGETTQNVYNVLKQSENISAKAIVDDANVTDVVSTISNAEIALQSIVNIRDKVISAYLDIIKMQI